MKIRGQREGFEPNLSIAVLAGGRSKRMGRDKAFLYYKDRSFIEIITEEIAPISNDISVVVRKDQKDQFSAILDREFRILHDEFDVSNPLGGMLAGFTHARHTYSAVLACDAPLVRKEVVRLLLSAALGHSAAVPAWENGDTEPLCAVYDTEQARQSTMAMITRGELGPRRMLGRLSDVAYVGVSSLREVDPSLGSLVNVNTAEDYLALQKKGLVGLPTTGQPEDDLRPDPHA
jgi:molybdopterin-guanine dinucleotide biosynthesis protein A